MTLWSSSRKRHLPLLQAVAQEELPKKLHLTANSKTGISIDFPVHQTCSPTRVCAGLCYALQGFMTFPNAVKQQGRNQALVDRLIEAPLREVHAVADSLWRDLPRGYDWLRWNGAGDLSLGAVRLINVFAYKYPEIRLWIISRLPELAGKIRDAPSIRLLLSIDQSTPPVVLARLTELTNKYKKGRARLAYTRVALEDVPPKDAYVVFNKHAGRNKNAWPHEHVCPASLPGASHEGACDPCRWCFK